MRIYARCLLWCCLVSLTWPASATTIVIAGDDVNVHSGPGRTYTVVEVVARDEHFTVLAERDGWYKISVEGRIGWISARSAAPARDESLDAVLARADRYFGRRQFITPAEANAFDLYQEVLRQDPDNRHARRQIAEMARIYKSWSEIAAQRGDNETARVYAERSRFVAPKDGDQEWSGPPGGSSGSPAVTQPLPIYRLRAAPAAVSAEGLRQMLRDYRFNHPADWSKHGLSPSLTGSIRHDYERLTAADGASLVADYATNLLWQHSSPPTPFTWDEARAYIRQLNESGHGGHRDWRLPTLEELASLLEPAKSANDLYLDAAFGSAQRWCWSSDPVAATPGKVWYISFGSGGIQPHQIDASAFVLAVRTLR